MKRTATAALALLALSAATSAAVAEDDAVFERGTVDLKPLPGGVITAVTVDNRLGDVQIVGHDEPGISVHAMKRAPNRDTLERLKVSLVPDPNGPITVTSTLTAGDEARPVAAGSISIDLVVYVPRGAQVSAEVWRGTVLVEGVDAGAEANVNEGDIAVQRVRGTVVTHTASGRQELSEIAGAVEARGIDGDVELDNIRGSRLYASVHRGSVSGRDLEVAELHIIAVRGDVTLEGRWRAGGSYVVRALRGNIKVRYGGTGGLRVTARAPKGMVRLAERFEQRPAPSGDVIGFYGSGRTPAEMSLRAGTGNVTVTHF